MRIQPCALSLLMLAFVVRPVIAQPPQPGPELAPGRVVEIQLDALKQNDEPEPDTGIARTWAFAHPDNRAMTGPLERFAAMLKSPPYAPLLNHRRHAIEPVGRSDAVAMFMVTVVAASGPVLTYQWTLRRVESGNLAGAWMTVAVSPPVKRGDSI